MNPLENNTLVYIDQHGLLGSNYYWRKRDDYGISIDELIAAGVSDERVLVHKDIIQPLQAVDAFLQTRGFRLYISEGFRPKALYELMYARRSTLFGKDQTDRLVNMQTMPHTTGMTVDVTFADIGTKIPLRLRNTQDGPDALFVDFYKTKSDPGVNNFQEQQELLKNAMVSHGFALGTKNEYFHFNYQEKK